MYLQENSIYTTKADYDAIVADQSKAMDVLVFNFFAMLGLMNAVTHPGDVARIKRFFRSDKKLQLSNISDDNNDISLAIKIASEAGLFRTDITAKEITRFLVKLKKGDIDEIDSRIVGKWAKALKPLALQSVSNPRMKKAFKDFADDGGETIDVSRLAVLGKRIAKQSEYSGDFRIYAKKYGKLQEITPKHIASDGSSDTTTQTTSADITKASALPSVKSILAQNKALKDEKTAEEKAAEDRQKKVDLLNSDIRILGTNKFYTELPTNLFVYYADRDNISHNDSYSFAQDKGGLFKRWLELYEGSINKDIPWNAKDEILTFNIISGTIDNVSLIELSKVNMTFRNLLRANYIKRVVFKISDFKLIQTDIAAILFNLYVEYSPVNKIPDGVLYRLKDRMNPSLYNMIRKKFEDLDYIEKVDGKTLIRRSLEYIKKNYNISTFIYRTSAVKDYITSTKDNGLADAYPDFEKSTVYEGMIDAFTAPFILSQMTDTEDVLNMAFDVGYNSNMMKKAVGVYLDDCHDKGKILKLKDYPVASVNETFVKDFVEVADDFIEWDNLKKYFSAAVVSGVDPIAYNRILYSIARTKDTNSWSDWVRKEFVKMLESKVTPDQKAKLVKTMYVNGAPLLDQKPYLVEFFKSEMKIIEKLIKEGDLKKLSNFIGEDLSVAHTYIINNSRKKYQDGDITRDEFIDIIKKTTIQRAELAYTQTPPDQINARMLTQILLSYNIKSSIDEEDLSEAILRTTEGKSYSASTYSEVRQFINHKSDNTQILELIKRIKDSDNYMVFSKDNYTSASRNYGGTKRENQLEFIQFVSECFYASAGTDLEDYMSDIIDSYPPVVQNNIRGNLIGISALAVELDDAPIKTFKKLGDAEIRNILRMNDVNWGSVSSGSLPRRKKGEKISEYIKRAKNTKVQGTVLEPQKIEEYKGNVTPEVQTSMLIDNHYAAKHGNIYPKIKKIYNSTTSSDGYDAFMSEIGNRGDGEIIPAFHGTGGVAASMIMRYGFRIIKATDSSVVGRMLGNGIYFSNKIDKASQYISNDGYGRQIGSQGYLFEMKAALGVKGQDYRSAGTGNDHIRSPEWCVFSTRQLKIEKVYEVVLDYYTNYKSVLKEAENLSFKEILTEQKIRGSNTIEFRFRDGLIPFKTKKGDIEFVDFEDAIKSNLIKKELIEFSSQGPVLVFKGFKYQEFYDYRYGSDIGGNKLSLLLKLIKAHK